MFIYLKTNITIQKNMNIYIKNKEIEIMRDNDNIIFWLVNINNDDKFYILNLLILHSSSDDLLKNIFDDIYHSMQIYNQIPSFSLFIEKNKIIANKTQQTSSNLHEIIQHKYTLSDKLHDRFRMFEIFKVEKLKNNMLIICTNKTPNVEKYDIWELT